MMPLQIFLIAEDGVAAFFDRHQTIRIGQLLLMAAEIAAEFQNLRLHLLIVREMAEIEADQRRMQMKDSLSLSSLVFHRSDFLISSIERGSKRNPSG